MSFESIFTFWDLKKVPWIALLCTANFEQVIIISLFANFEQVTSHFADFEQVIIKIVILLNLNKSKKLTARNLMLMHGFFCPTPLVSSLTLPWTIARFLDPFYTFSPAHRRVIRDFTLPPIWMHRHPVFKFTYMWLTYGTPCHTRGHSHTHVTYGTPCHARGHFTHT